VIWLCATRTWWPGRKRLIGAAEGRVLEIGIGSGLNLPCYRNSREIIGLEPSPRLLAMARRVAEKASTSVTLIEGSAVAIPIEDRSIDTVVTTWTLCTIPDAARALSEMRRVLKPSGAPVCRARHGPGGECARMAKWADASVEADQRRLSSKSPDSVYDCGRRVRFRTSRSRLHARFETNGLSL
jgi:ubiquinone/menaquinone biosynthesis C-methylase UbiE